MRDRSHLVQVRGLLRAGVARKRVLWKRRSGIRKKELHDVSEEKQRGVLLYYEENRSTYLLLHFLSVCRS